MKATINYLERRLPLFRWQRTAFVNEFNSRSFLTAERLSGNSIRQFPGAKLTTAERSTVNSPRLQPGEEMPVRETDRGAVECAFIEHSAQATFDRSAVGINAATFFRRFHRRLFTFDRSAVIPVISGNPCLRFIRTKNSFALESRNTNSFGISQPFPFAFLKRCVLFVLFLFIAVASFAQAQKTLSLEEYLSLVKKFHPVAKQAALGVEIAKANVTSARGAFDPVLSSDIARKEFGGLLYYDDQLTELKVPTWYGVDFVTGIESLSGERTSTPDTKGNSSYFGFSVPVGKGLLMDKRRSDLQQAKIFTQLSLQEQRTVLNDLLYEASKAYWTWWQQYQTQLLFQQAIKNAAQRFEFTKTAYRLGDRPAIDTVEALSQLQGFALREAEIALSVTNTGLDAGVFLWTESGEAFTMPQGVVPQQPTMLAPELLQPDALMQGIALHPELQQYRFKLEALNVEKRLKFQSLLPQVYLKYNQLAKSHDVSKNFSSPLLQNNYRYGLSVAVPLRFSEGRGEYRKAKLKIEQTQWQQEAKRIGLQNKLQQYYNEWKGLRQQTALQQGALQSFSTLLRGEEIKFNNGESSLFLINAREQKVLETQQKLIELQSKEGKAAASTLWAAGVLANR